MPDKVSSRPNWAGPLFLFSYSCFFVGCLFAIEGAWRMHRQDVESTQWPSVPAEISKCYVGETYPFRSDGGSVVYWTRCHFRYSINGAQHESTTSTTSTRSAAMVERMKRWTNLHHKGTTFTIHYDPENPDRISVAGADEEIQTHTGGVKLRIAGVLVASSLLSLLLAFIARASKPSPDARVDARFRLSKSYIRAQAFSDPAWPPSAATPRCA
jgi:hypothetical protein